MKRIIDKNPDGVAPAEVDHFPEPMTLTILGTARPKLTWRGQDARQLDP